MRDWASMQPPRGGNSDVLVDEPWRRPAAGARLTRVYCRKLKLQGCLNAAAAEDPNASQGRHDRNEPRLDRPRP